MIDDIRIDGRSNVSVDRKSAPDDSKESTFASIIKGAVDNVDALENSADISIMNLLKGKEEIHETMIALQKADVSMRLILTIRNKAIEAYREIMHMQF